MIGGRYSPPFGEMIMHALQKRTLPIRTVFIFLTLIGLLAYVNSFRVPFHYDDISFLRNNAAIRSFQLFFHWITEHYSRILTGRAFLLFTFCINYTLTGLDTFWYHFVNLFIHISTAFLFYLLLSQYVDTEKDESYHLKSVLVSVLFLLHPIQTESVTYISSRSSELSTLLILASMLMFFNATHGKFRPLDYALSMFFFILGLSTKQAAIVAPALMVLFDYYFISPGGKRLRARLKYHLPFWGIILAGSFYYAGFILHPEMPDRNWPTHVLTELKVVIAYLRLLILPYGLTIDHDIKESAVLDPAAVFSIMMIIGLLLTAFLIRKRNKILSFSILLFFLSLTPFLIIRLSDYMAERWVYTAALGFSLGLGEILVTLSQRYKKIGVSVIAGVMLLFGILTHLRNDIYKSPITLWKDATIQSPEKVRPYTNLCASYLEGGEVNKAIEMCAIAIQKGSEYDEPYINLASAYFLKKDLNKAEAILLSLASKDTMELYHYNLGVIYNAKKEYRKAIAEYNKVLKFRPRSPSALASLGECYGFLNLKDKADMYYRLSTKGLPQSGEDYIMLAESFFRLGEKEKGTESLSKALIAEPLNLNIRRTIAVAYLKEKNYDEAYKHFSIIAKISPTLATAYHGMGSALYAKGNLKEAKKLFKKALILLPTDSNDRNELLNLIDKI